MTRALRPTVPPRLRVDLRAYSYTPAEFAARYDAHSEVVSLLGTLTGRDTDPAYATAPVLDTYARISKDPDGTEEKTDRQTLDILRAMVRDGYRLGLIHCDDHKSAWKRDRVRPGWDRLLGRVKARDVAGAYCWHVDRLMRQPYDLEALINLADAGTIVASCLGDYGLSSSDSRFTLRILVAAACKASDDTSRRACRKNESRRLEQGVMDGGNCFGFGGPGISAERLESEREAILWGIRAVVSGASWRTVADEWNARGIVSRNGLPMNPLKVRAMLTLPRHAGIVTYGEGSERREVRTMAGVTPLIDRALWDEFMSIVNARRRGRPVNVSDYLLTGMLRCGACGHGMHGTMSGVSARKIRCYRCAVNGCNGNYVRAELAEAIARGHALDILADLEHSQVIRQSSALSNVERKIETLAAREAAITKRFGLGEISEATWNQALATLAPLMTKLTTERDRLMGNGASPTARRTLNRTELEAAWEKGDTLERRALLRSAMPRGMSVKPPEVRNIKGTLENTVPRFSRIDK